jgi:hypothetical protein
MESYGRPGSEVGREREQGDNEGGDAERLRWIRSRHVDILARHPSPREGDIRKGVLALLPRDCNL